MKRPLKHGNDGPDSKKSRSQSNESIKSNMFSHKDDIEQFETMLKSIQTSNLIIHLKVSSIISKEIAEFSCGEIRACDNINCKSDVEISLLLSEKTEPTLYQKDDILIDNNAKGFFDDDFIFIYCNQCKNTGSHCKRCNSFRFGSQCFYSCCRCGIRICDLCGGSCNNPLCKIQYCMCGDTTSFTSGCGERFLSEIECSKCDTEYRYCHGCEDQFEDLCSECKKTKRKKKKKRKKKSKKNIIYDIWNKKKVCNKCESEDCGDNEGRTCDCCNIFICGDHCDKYGRFCRGVCDKYCCNDCVKKGELNECHRGRVKWMVCTDCEYKCENCWDFLMIRGVDDEDIEKILRNGNFSDYFDD